MELATWWKVLLPPFWIDMVTNSNLPYSAKSSLATCIWIGLSVAYFYIMYQVMVTLERFL